VLIIACSSTSHFPNQFLQIKKGNNLFTHHQALNCVLVLKKEANSSHLTSIRKNVTKMEDIMKLGEKE